MFSIKLDITEEMFSVFFIRAFSSALEKLPTLECLPIHYYRERFRFREF
jgi:hypothetical protein